MAANNASEGWALPRRASGVLASCMGSQCVNLQRIRTLLFALRMNPAIFPVLAGHGQRRDEDRKAGKLSQEKFNCRSVRGSFSVEILQQELDPNG
jgi:hypothetical protein